MLARVAFANSLAVKGLEISAGIKTFRYSSGVLKKTVRQKADGTIWLRVEPFFLSALQPLSSRYSTASKKIRQRVRLG